MRARLLLPLLAVLLAAAAPPLPPQLSDPTRTEGWIWQQVQAGQIADLNQRCDTPQLSVYQVNDPLWRAPCRNVDPALLRAVLTQPDLADHAPHGVRIRGARIDGRLDLSDAHVRAAEVWLDASWIAGDAVLADARLDGLLSLDGTRIDGNLDGKRAAIGGNLSMENAEFGGPVDLRDARVDGQMSMVGAGVADKQMFDAALLHVGGGLFLNSVTFGGPVDLGDAHVDSQMDMGRAVVADKQTFTAERLHVGSGGLFLPNVRFGGAVDLRDAHVDSQMDMERAVVADQQLFDADRLHVGSNFFARSVSFGGAIDFHALTVDGALDLRDSRVRQLDLAGAVVRDDLRLGGEGLWLHWDACDGPAPCLNLRNARVGNLQDDERAWPDHITLEGFSYAHLGGFGGEQRQDMRKRSVISWRDWLRRDPVYSAQPYAQLASVLAAAGNRDGAADIRFFGRNRERSELLTGCTWLQQLGLVDRPDDDRPCQRGAAIGQGALQIFVGYGIGDYTFRAVGWALVLAITGTVILCFAPGVRGVMPSRLATNRGPRQKSLLWCFGASLHQVLPLVSINQEFGDFFNDPKRERLSPWQHVAFGFLALCGWALGLFVVAAFSGLIQN